MLVSELFTNIFNAGTSVEDRGLIEIKGVFNGTIRQGGDVFIMPSGRFAGRIEARNVEIAGVVQGDVEAESLVIHSSGQLYYGKLKYQHLSVQDGGTMVNKGEKGREQVNDAQEEVYPMSTASAGYPSEAIVVDPVEAAASRKVPSPDDASVQANQEDLPLINESQPDAQEAKPEQNETGALTASEEKPQRDRKQPHFYLSY